MRPSYKSNTCDLSSRMCSDDARRVRTSSEAKLDSVVPQKRPRFYSAVGDGAYTHQDIYDLVVKYFGNITMTKIVNPNPMYSTYVAKYDPNKDMFVSDRYMIAITYSDMASVGSRSTLSSLEWICLQTRTIKDHKTVEIYEGTGVKSFTYDRPRPGSSALTSNAFMSTRIVMTKDEGEITVYEPVSVGAPKFSVKILNSKGKQSEGTVQEAIETFDTLIVLN